MRIVEECLGKLSRPVCLSAEHTCKGKQLRNCKCSLAQHTTIVIECAIVLLNEHKPKHSLCNGEMCRLFCQHATNTCATTSIKTQDESDRVTNNSEGPNHFCSLQSDYIFIIFVIYAAASASAFLCVADCFQYYFGIATEIGQSERARSGCAEVLSSCAQCRS